MSDFSNDRKPKRPSNEVAGGDPWAKWRQPEAPAVATPVVKPAAVDVPKKTESKAEIKSEALPVPEVRERPTGTLSVNRSAMAPAKVAPKKAYEKPYKKPSTAAGSRS